MCNISAPSCFYAWGHCVFVLGSTFLDLFSNASEGLGRAWPFTNITQPLEAEGGAPIATYSLPCYDESTMPVRVTDDVEACLPLSDQDRQLFVRQDGPVTATTSAKGNSKLLQTMFKFAMLFKKGGRRLPIGHF